MGSSARGAALSEGLVGLTVLSALVWGLNDLAQTSTQRHADLASSHEMLWQLQSQTGLRLEAERQLLVPESTLTPSEQHTALSRQLPISGWPWLALQPWIAGLKWTRLPELQHFDTSGMGMPIGETP